MLFTFNWEAFFPFEFDHFTGVFKIQFFSQKLKIDFVGKLNGFFVIFLTEMLNKLGEYQHIFYSAL